MINATAFWTLALC